MGRSLCIVCFEVAIITNRLMRFPLVIKTPYRNEDYISIMQIKMQLKKGTLSPLFLI